MRNNIIFFLAFLMITSIIYRANALYDNSIKITLQLKEASTEESGALIISQQIQHWKPSETAFLVVNMCAKDGFCEYSPRLNELAPAMDNVLDEARKQGVLIVHAPVGCTSYYRDHPAFKLGNKYNDRRINQYKGKEPLKAENVNMWPESLLLFGTDNKSDNISKNPGFGQHKKLNIKEGDAISESGTNIAGLFKARKIRNVVYLGLFANTILIEESFGIRNMKRLGMNVAIMRDMTDVSFAPAKGLSHFSGISLMMDYIETFICPSVVSSEFTGKKQFRFQDDKRPIIAFIIAEDEYRSNQRLPEFAKDHLIMHNINCEYALGIPTAEGEGRHSIENLQILYDADLAVISVRRRALEPEKMDLIKNFLNKGKPVLAYRTSSHAFDAKGNVPREGGGIIASGLNVSEYLSQWPEFDMEILGGNYMGHYGHLQEGTEVFITPGMENHSILKGVTPEGFNSPSWLYKNRPLRSDNVQVLLFGRIPDTPDEPVLWVHLRGKGKVVYTSLGHWDDWKNPNFQSIILNSLYYLLNP